MLYLPREPQIIITDRILEQRRTNIWASMGIGKTSAVLTALDHIELVEDGPTLAIGPLRVAESTWPDEVAKWDHLSSWRVSPILGDPGARLKALKQDANLFTVNFENVPWLVEHFSGRKRWPFSKVVFDECTRLQGFRLRQGSAQAKALAQVAHDPVARWINLTGTPAPNGLLGLWGQNWFVDEGVRLGRSFSDFRARWFTTVNETGHWDKNPNYKVPVIRPHEHSQAEITDRLRDVAVSLNARDYFDVKEPIKNIIKVRLPAKARMQYREMEKHFYAEIGGFGVEAVNSAVKSIKLLQIASGNVYVDDTGQWREVHDAKMQALRSVIMEANGAPVLAIYHWKPTLRQMQKAFSNSGVLLDSKRSLDAWNRGEIQVGFAHPQSIGHGTSLQHGGNIICHVDQWWDFERHDQINERLGPLRQLQSGYDREVFEHYIVAEDTTDELVLLRHETKRSVQDILREAMKAKGLV